MLKKVLVVAAILMLIGMAGTVRAESLSCNPPPAGSTAVLFYYINFSNVTGVTATYTTALPFWFSGTGGVAAAPDSTGATGFRLALPSGTTQPVSGTVMACDGTGCTATVPFGPPALPSGMILTNP
jgi:hypothetical protein